jgi:hypothetical protein
MKPFDVFSMPADRDAGMKAIIGKLPAALGSVFRATWESIQRVHPEQDPYGAGGDAALAVRRMDAEQSARSR